VFGLGLQLGHPLPPLASWSQKQCEDAFEALRSVLGVGLIQNDIRDRNFVQDDLGRTPVVDFEDTSIIDSSSSEDCGAYLTQAWEYLKSMQPDGKNAEEDWDRPAGVCRDELVELGGEESLAISLTKLRMALWRTMRSPAFEQQVAWSP